MRRRDFFASAVVLLAKPDAELSDDDRLLLETTQLLGVVSGGCDKFSLVQQYMHQRQAVQTHLETKHPGLTVDWSVIPAALKAK